MEFFVSHFYAEARTISVTGAEYLRVASLAVAAYDILRPSLACVLFVLIRWVLRCYHSGPILRATVRYTSILVLITASVGYWGEFTAPACGRYYMIVPVVKTVQSVICQAILSVRTYALSKRSNRAGYFLIGMFVTFAIVRREVPLHSSLRFPPIQHLRCGSGNAPGQSVAWIFFVFAMIYDVVTLCMSAYYLLGKSPVEYFS
ncbi:hypothetical protein AURDEDRAFT_67116 [Auricularia subglabra TFB-10046 SS5]|nr:hypothetical protein AURDEDRAFT_67116 [Auricularia subglabra TFB-10046 SS5]